MASAFSLLLLCLATLAGRGARAAPAASTGVCNVLDFGATGDSVTEDTAAVGRALSSQCARAGGTVLLPGGHTFLLRPIELPTRTRLRLDGDIRAWPDYKTWPNSTVRYCTVSTYESKVPILVPKKESLLWAVNTTGVVISGRGTVHGGGQAWWDLWAKQDRRMAGYWHNCRPSLVEFGIGQATRAGPSHAGSNIDLVVTGITLQDSPFWTFVARGARNLRIDGVTITTPPCDHPNSTGYASAPNTDGFNIGNSHGVLITNSYVRNRDDCVPLFPPISNVTVRNITCECGNGLVPCVWPAGSQPGHGGNISDVTFDGATFIRSNMALAIKSLPTFVGYVRNVSYSNIILQDVGTAVMMNVNNQQGVRRQARTHGGGGGGGGGGPAVGVSSFSNIRITNVTGTAKSPGKFVCDASRACTSITMTNVAIQQVQDTAGRDPSVPPPPPYQYTCSHATGASEGCTPDPTCLHQPTRTP